MFSGFFQRNYVFDNQIDFTLRNKMITKEEVTEKKLELLIEAMGKQLIQDLHQIIDISNVNSSNIERMKDCFNCLGKAEYFIVKAISHARGLELIDNNSIKSLLEKAFKIPKKNK